MYAHQDWDTYVFRVKQKDNAKNEKSIRQAQQNGVPIETIKKPKVSNNIKLEEDPEVFVHKKIDKQLADAIRNKRCELNLTQASLAQRINEKPNVVQEIETMKAVYNHVIINKVLKALGLTLKSIKNK